jgi:hypothetical protein
MSSERDFALSEFIKNPESILKIIDKIEESKQADKWEDLQTNAKLLVESLQTQLKNPASLRILMAFLGLVALIVLTRTKANKKIPIDDETQSKLSGYIAGISYSFIKSVVDKFLDKCSLTDKLIVQSIIKSPTLRYRPVREYLIDKYADIENKIRSNEEINNCESFFRIEMFKRLPSFLKNFEKDALFLANEQSEKEIQYQLSPDRPLTIERTKSASSSQPSSEQKVPVEKPPAPPVGIPPAPPAPPVGIPSAPPAPTQLKQAGTFGSSKNGQSTFGASGTILQKITNSCELWTQELFGLPNPLENMSALRTLWSIISELPNAPQDEFIRNVTNLYKQEQSDTENINRWGKSNVKTFWHKMLPTVLFSNVDILDDIAYWCFEVNDDKTWKALTSYVQRVAVTFESNEVTKFVSEFLDGARTYALAHSTVFVQNETWKHLNRFLEILVNKMKKKENQVNPRIKTNLSKIQQQVRNVLRSEIEIIFKLKSESGTESDLHNILTKELIPNIVTLADPKILREILKMKIDLLDAETSPLYVLSSEKWSTTLQSFAETFKKIAKAESAFRVTSLADGNQGTYTIDNVNRLINQTINEIVENKLESVSSYIAGEAKGVKSKLQTRETEQLKQSEKTLLIQKLDKHKEEVQRMYVDFKSSAQRVSDAKQEQIRNQISALNGKIQANEDLPEIKNTNDHLQTFTETTRSELTREDEKKSSDVGRQNAGNEIQKEIKSYEEKISAEIDANTRKDETYTTEVKTSNEAIDKKTADKVQSVEREKQSLETAFQERVQKIKDLEQKTKFNQAFGRILLIRRESQKPTDLPTILKTGSDEEKEIAANVKELRNVEQGGDALMAHKSALKEMDKKIEEIKKKGEEEKKDAEGKIFARIRVKYAEDKQAEIQRKFQDIEGTRQEKSEKYTSAERTKLEKTFETRLNEQIQKETERIAAIKQKIATDKAEVRNLGLSIQPQQKQAIDQEWSKFSNDLRKRIYEWLGIKEQARDRSIEDYELALTTVLPNLVTLNNTGRIDKSMRPHMISTFRTLKKKTQSPRVDEMALSIRIQIK